MCSYGIEIDFKELNENNITSKKRTTCKISLLLRFVKYDINNILHYTKIAFNSFQKISFSLNM